MIFKVPLLWLWIVLFVVLMVVLGVFILMIVRHMKTKKQYQQEQEVIDNYYVNIIESVGGINNILKVEALQSRLSFYLKDQSLLQSEKLKEIHIHGIVKTSKKITLVVGEMAVKYATNIQKEMEQGGNK